MLKRVAVMSAVIGLASACGQSKTPTAPTLPASGRFVVAMEIEAPPSLPRGTTAQLRVVTRYSDGAREDITAAASWSSSDRDVLRVDAGGVVTALADGESEITAVANNLTARTRVLVLDAGTWKVTGRVVEEDSTPLGNARIAVTAGTGAGKSTTSNAAGSFSLYGVAGEITLQVSRDAFQTAMQTVVVTSHQTLAPIKLQLSAPLPTIAGDWRLTLEASPGCSGLPDAVKRRTYVATFAQSSTSITARLSGATFVHTYYTANYLPGRVQGTTLMLHAYSWNYYGTAEYTFAEQVDDKTVLALSGAGALAIQASTISGTFSGSLIVSTGPTAPLLACDRPDHRLTFERTANAIRRSTTW
jgi:hypothetical protein